MLQKTSQQHSILAYNDQNTKTENITCNIPQNRKG